MSFKKIFSHLFISKDKTQQRRYLKDVKIGECIQIEWNRIK